LAGHYHGNSFKQHELKTIEDNFLTEPVVAVHCKAGKGRTGLVIVCFLIYAEIFGTVEEAVRHYDETRTPGHAALTI
jgi:protein-tyrosine phosphatase